MSRFMTHVRSVIAVAAVAAATLAQTHHADAAGLLIAEGGFGGVLQIQEQEVEVTINNGVAVTQVTQVFRNTENRQVEALYLFPVPKGASVANFSMWINGKEMIGEVVEKQRAREIYDSYKQVRRDPGLLEQVDYKNFEMRIFPIGPGAEQRVQITYYQELDFDHDWATYVYPLATSPKPGIDAATQGRFAINLHVKSQIPITELESPSHPDEFVIVPHGVNYVEASLETDKGDLNRDVVLAFHTTRPRTGIDVITSKQRGEDGYFQLTLTAGEELAEAYTGMDYVFLLDVSGSMANSGKLGLSRGSIGSFIAELGAEDRFELITFNVAPNTLFNALEPVTDERQQQAVEFLRSQQARGGTVLRPAMETAYKYGDPDRPLNVVVLSDGMTEQAERAELLAAIAARPANARVFCIGVGNDVNRPLLSQMADDAGGLAAFLSAGDNLERQAEAFRRKLLRPAAANVKISFGGAEVYDLEPKQLPNLYHGMPVRLYGRYRDAGKVGVTVAAEINGAPIEQTVAVDFPSNDPANPEIERMWAWHKVDRLLKEGDRAGSRSAVIDEIVRLGEGYSIVTEYTSFLVLENDAEYQRWQIERRNLLRVERDRAGQQIVQNQLAQLREEALAGLGPQDTGAASQQVPSETPTSVTPNLSTPNITPAPSTGTDLDFAPRTTGGGGGMGAFDPLTSGIGAILIGIGLAMRRRRESADETVRSDA